MADGTPIRTAIIGYGLSGRIFHAPFIAANPRFSLEAVSTSDPARREQARHDHPGIQIAGSPAELLAQRFDLGRLRVEKRPDARIVETWGQLHRHH